MTQISIVMPVFNKINFTISALKDLFNLEIDYEILLIDNASTDETKEKLCQINKPNFIYINNSENLFHSKACNQGFGLASGEYILFLNNDIRVKSNYSNWIQTLVSACDKTGGLVGPTMGQLDKNLNFVKEANSQLTGNSYLGGWCIVAKREVWEKLKIGNTDQIWNEDFPFYFNDTDLSFRARKKSIPLTAVSLPEVVHFGKISAQQINVHKLYNEGRQIFVKKWGK